MDNFIEKFIMKVENIKNLDWLFTLISKIGISVIQLILAGIIFKISVIVIKKSLKVNPKLSERKRQTVSEILSSSLRYIIYFIVIFNILANFGVNITSLITIASVGSVAIGFGAQSLVQDIITGMFILFEDQFGVGDVIQIDRLTGTVESIGLRTTRIRSFDGDLHILPNGSIKIVTNMSKDFNRAKIDINIAYEENIDYVIDIIKDELNNIFNKNLIKGIISPPEVLGIIELAESAVIVRILIDTKVGENWKTEREIRRFIKNRFDKENIEIPYTKRVIEIKNTK